ncbi:hypothetical protein [Arthrobacter woluwensis]|uniref:hypothetical protein n=1 Tax=Arthrobacter woluwensis TaxID=156980 RepID=UPI0011A3E695|nr:hypothetical protein [Arthrobacter woluwensis]
MTDTRDELADLGRLILGKTAPEAARCVLAAGYRKPRLVSTAAELDKLPVGSVVLDTDGDVYTMGRDKTWIGTGYESFTSSQTLAHWGPITVLDESHNRTRRNEP